MKIVFNPDIRLFENKTKTQIIKSIPKYKKYFKPILEQFVSEVELDSQYINAIIILPNKSTYGTVKPFIQNKKTYFDIEISDEIVPYISYAQDSTEKFKAKSVIQHELFHCKEIKYLNENNIFTSTCPLDDEFKITSTYNFLYDEAVKLWSEFYAVYNNRKINMWHEFPDVRPNIEEIQKWLLATLTYSENLDDHQTKIPSDMLYSLHTFWYNMTTLIALHIQSNEDILIQDYKNSKSRIIQEYFKYIYSTLKTYLSIYPTWLSEDNYIKLGKAFMTIIRFYHLDFSTIDLSDNFILKYTK